MAAIRIRTAVLIIMLSTVLTGSIFSQNSIVTQISTIDALMAGLYDGEYQTGQLKMFGDFGIGTFNSLDGEMVMLNNNVYKLKSNGEAELVDDKSLTPYAVVTHFNPSEVASSVSFGSMKELGKILDGMLKSENYFYAVKLTGTFSAVKVRSVPKQARPYIPLVEVIKKQSEFNFENIKGTLVGFRCPSFVKGINVPGYHFHFISEDLKSGGHLLEVQASAVKYQIQQLNGFKLLLPGDEEFMKVNLNADRTNELNKVEKK
ncbi:MAG: acetolactate decarboxylase [Syntrophothermus sp.]